MIYDHAAFEAAQQRDLVLIFVMLGVVLFATAVLPLCMQLWFWLQRIRAARRGESE